MRLRIDLAYDGAPFHGFARQPDVPTVQGELESALARVLGQDVALTCAGRTDAGVHASGQVVHLDVDASVDRAARALKDLDDLRASIDKMAGPAITVWSITGVSEDFDARFSAVDRRYRYRIIDGAAMHPLDRFDAWHVPGPLDVEAMQRAARHFLGEHDFAAFCRKPADGHTLRRLDDVNVERVKAGEIHVGMRGPAFCHQQVRSIVGCLVHIGLGKRPADWAADVLARRDRSRAPALAPPAGLVLEEVRYGEGIRRSVD